MAETEKVKVLSIKGIIMVSAVLAMFVGLCFGLGGLPVLGLTVFLSYLGSRRSVKVNVATFLHNLAKETAKQRSSTAASPPEKVKAGKKGRSKNRWSFKYYPLSPLIVALDLIHILRILVTRLSKIKIWLSLSQTEQSHYYYCPLDLDCGYNLLSLNH